MDADLRRFYAKLTLPNENGCMLWLAAKNEKGYGVFSVGGKTVRAHRWLYERLQGPIPVGLEPDHLCRVRACVNPEHIELVTHQENLRRGIGIAQRSKTMCPHGHLYSPGNTWRDKRGYRWCKACRNRRVKAFKARRRQCQ